MIRRHVGFSAVVLRTSRLFFFQIYSVIFMMNYSHCRNCGQVGHASNADRCCPYYRRDPDRHRDAPAGDNVPHMSQLDIRVFADGVQQAVAMEVPHWYEGRALEIFVNDVAFELGRASGDGCNCLIDTLRQKLPGIICSVAAVRAELEERHRGTASHIPGDYLDIDSSLEIIDLSRAFNEVARVSQSWAHRFQVVCVDLTWLGNGEVLPREVTSGSRTTLHIARANQNHFVPLFKPHGRSATSGSSEVDRLFGFRKKKFASQSAAQVKGIPDTGVSLDRTVAL